MENVHKGFEKYNCDECAKISYKILDWSNILQLFMKKDSIVINVAKLLLEDAIWKCSWKKLWIQLWSLWQKFHQSFHESDKTLDWNYKLQLFMKMKRFNFDQCGKNFAIGCNLNDHEIDSYNWIVNISFFGFGLISYFFYNSVFLKVFYVLFYSSVLCPVLLCCFLSRSQKIMTSLSRYEVLVF